MPEGAAPPAGSRWRRIPFLATFALLPLPIFVLWMGPSVYGSIDRAPPESWALAVQEEGPSPFSEQTGHAFCAQGKADRDCAGPRTPCVAHPPVHPRWLVGKTTTDGRRIAGVHDNFMYGFQLSFAGGRRWSVNRYDRMCVHGDESPSWKQRRADLEEQERRDRAESAAFEERWRKLMPDAGIPRLQVHDLPMPPLRLVSP